MCCFQGISTRQMKHRASISKDSAISRCSASTSWISGALKVVNRVITLQWTPKISLDWIHFHGSDPGAGWFISGSWPEHAATAHLPGFYGSSCIVLTAETLVHFNSQLPHCCPYWILTWKMWSSPYICFAKHLKGRECQRQSCTSRSWSVVGDVKQ